MNFLISDTFTDSLARLTGDEQKAVKTTAFDLQMNPANPGMSFHKLDKAKDKNFWSVRANADLRIIVHKTTDSLLLCYVDHHDKAYQWAERRKLQTHPTTRAAQIVEIREKITEILVPVYVQAESAVPLKPAIFANRPDSELLGYGVPPEWLEDVKNATEDNLLTLVDHLPGEAAEDLLELATGGKPRSRRTADLKQTQPMEAMCVEMDAFFIPPDELDAFEHPDARRRFRAISSPEELQAALDAPWEKWTVFLHPDQRQWVERYYNGPARVSGSAGTGKTIVALHRAVHLARAHPDSRILLATFSGTLSNALSVKLRRLIGNQPRLAERIDVHSLDSLAIRLHKAQLGPVSLASKTQIRELLEAASKETPGHKFSMRFLISEWEQIVDAWHLDSWEAYRDVARLGRKTRLPEAQRSALWSIFEKVRNALTLVSIKTLADVYTSLATTLEAGKAPPYEFAVIDEAQDLSVSQLRFFAALGSGRPNALFFAGDIGQRIFQQPFSWLSLGVDIRGRSRTLRVNYRTSHQIRQQADRLLGPEIADVDGNREDRSDTISVFNGPPPTIQILTDEAGEQTAVARWLEEQANAGILPHEIGVFVRSEAQLARAKTAIELAGLPVKILDEQMEGSGAHVSLCTMHLAKGLEFRAVVVMACDDEIVPLQERIETVGDNSDLQEVYDTERQLLYVACTRARDHLLITSAGPASEFLDDLNVG